MLFPNILTNPIISKSQIFVTSDFRALLSSNKSPSILFKVHFAVLLCSVVSMCCQFIPVIF